MRLARSLVRNPDIKQFQFSLGSVRIGRGGASRRDRLAIAIT